MVALSESARQLARGGLESLPRPVRIVFFTQTFGCDTCYDQQRLLNAVSELSPHITISECNLVLEPARAASYGITLAPSLAVLAVGDDGTEIDYGVRFVGVTAGFEFQSLVDAIRLVSGGDSTLTDASRRLLNSIAAPVTIRVFVTPTCSFCGGAVGLAYRMAIESPWVTAFAVEVSEYPDLIRQYRVNGVPKIVVNDRHEWLGQQVEDVFVADVVNAITAGSPPPA